MGCVQNSISSTALAGEVAEETAKQDRKSEGVRAVWRVQENSIGISIADQSFFGGADAPHPLRPLWGHLPRSSVSFGNARVEEVLGGQRLCS